MAKVALISSAGGHLTEVLAIAQELKGRHDLFLCVTNYPAVRGMKLEEVQRIYFAPIFWREQDCGFLLKLRQQIGVTVTMVLWLFTFLRIFWKERPDYLITVGAEIAVPAYLINRLFFRRPALYVESLARIDTPSLTGKLVSRLSDRVFVQWQGVLPYYGAKGEYHGRLI
jgi:beta-1,4-N-acetylglucosaminyltransferase